MTAADNKKTLPVLVQHNDMRSMAIPGGTALSKVLNQVVALAAHAGAVLLIAEIVLMSAAVFFRYVLRQPLVWSDELAELILIWQAMFGAVVAFHTGQHLRLNVLSDSLPAGGKNFLETVCLILTAAAAGPLAYFAFKDVLASADLVTPVLEISPAWETGALVVGLALIAVLAVGQLIQKIVNGNASTTLAAFGTALLILLAGLLLRDDFHSLGNLNLVIFFIGLVGVCIAIGLPIAFCFAIAAMAYIGFATYAPLDIVPARMETGMAHILLLSAPLFIALGSMLVISGMAQNLVKLLVALLGHVKGGLSYVLVGGMALLSGISGSKAADMAAIAPVLVPEMRRRGAKDGEIVGLLAASCAMSETIPPSLILIMTGAVTGVSIGALFAAGWYPALALAALLCVLARIRASGSDDEQSAMASWAVIRKLAIVAVPVLILPFLIRGAVVEGIATATEVATIGIAYVLVLTLVIERRFDWARLYSSLKDASTLTGIIFIILASANAMAWGFVQSGFSASLAGKASSLPGGAYGFLVVSIVLFIVLGSILEGVPAIVLLGPLLFPVAKSLGISDVHFALVTVLAMGLGLFAPPFGVGFYTACAICRVEPGVAMKAIWPYIGAILCGTILVAVGPLLANEFRAIW